MRYALLGVLEAADGDRTIAIGGPKQRLVLAHLLLRANHVVGVDRLIDALWGDDPPETARNTIQTYIRHLRKALGADAIDHRSGGYVLRVDPADVDVLRYEALLADARALTPTDPAAATERLREAAELWRGPPLDDLARQPSLASEIARLDALRLEATEQRIEAELELGRHRELVPELEARTRDEPYRERLWGQLMTALYRSGRQADALAAYGRATELLAGELGLDPSPELQRLHEAILRQEPSLEAAGTPLRGYRLLEEIGAGAYGTVHRAFQPQVGREVAVKVIHARFANDPAFIRRFETEAQLVARLEHPYIVPLYDFWREPDGAYLVVRYLRGGNLRQAIAHGPLGTDEVGRIVTQLAGALDVAHRQGVVHRDVTSSNVLFDDDRNAYLADFGIARVVGDGATDRSDPSGAWRSPELRRGEPATPAADVYGLARVAAEALTGDGDPDRLPAPVRTVLDRATDDDPAARHPSALVFAEALRRALPPGSVSLTPRTVDARNPFKGLRAFGQADAEDFFGRERIVGLALDRLREPSGGARLLAVVGPSGSGKSSIVRAGLVPALRRGGLPGSSRWFVAEMHPGEHPFSELAASLRTISVGEVADLASAIRSRGLLDPLDALVPEATEVLVVIDQFEELFTLVVDEAERARFLDVLADAVRDPRSRIRIVLTLRADLYDRPLSYPGFGDLLAARTLAITPLSSDELERTIVGPAERVGIAVDPDVAPAVVADVGDQPGTLPLVQYALTELFERRTEDSLTVEAYRRIGGVTGALARRADELFEALDPPGREAARQIFLRLVTLGDAGRQDVRRRVPRAELTSLEVDPAVVEQVIETFGAARLLSFDRDPETRGPTVEVAHEALLSAWDRLRTWIERAREDVRTHRRLVAAMREWLAADRDPSFLLRGARLAAFEAWSPGSALAATGDERAFLAASVEAREAERAAEELREARERRLERRSVVRLRALVLVLAIGVLLSGTLSVFAFGQRREAREQSVLARAHELALFSSQALEEDPQLALQLAMHAVRTTAEPRGTVLSQAADAVHVALQELGAQFPADAAVAVRVGPEGPRGVFDLPLATLLAFAEEHLEGSLSEEACTRYLPGQACPETWAPLDTSDLSLETPPQNIARVEAVGEGSLAGTQVRVSVPFDSGDLVGWQREMRRFQDQTGIRVVSDIITPSPSADRDFRPDADIMIRPTPSLLPPIADRALDLGAYLDVEELRRTLSPNLLELATVGDDGSWPSADGRLLGGWVKLALKSLVWYPIPEFEDAGYEIPRTWDELVALSDRIVADGGVPWCLGIGSGDATGWVATDWIENLVLRTAGPDGYDRWVTHEIGFQDPRIREAVELFGTIAFAPGYVRGGGRGAVRRDFYEAQANLLTDPPRCWLDHQASYAPSLWEGDHVLGRDAHAFPFPPVGGQDTAMLGSGDLIVQLEDRPEVREFVRFVTGPTFGRAWAALPGGGFISPHVDFDLDHYADPVIRRQAVATQRALADDAFRFDGSDMMPLEVGFDSFFTGMTRYLWQGEESLDEVLAEIDASWPSPS